MTTQGRAGMSRQPRSPGIIAWAVFFVSPAMANLPVAPQSEGPAPGRTNEQAPLVSLDEARLARSTNTGIGSAAELGSETDVTPEIASLAHGLKGDPQLIFEFVRNHIEYVPMYGSFKGATMTLIDGCGTDVDQAALMIALLRASGHTAGYVFGTVRIEAAPLAAWLGVDPDANVVGTLLATGGIPASVWVNGNGQLLYVDLEHVWVKVAIGGTDYVFDPSFKSHTIKQGIDLDAATGFDSAVFFAAATSGATVTSEYVQNLNASAIHTELSAYASNLTDHIRTAIPDASLADIVGGREIIAIENAPLRTTLPYETARYADWTDVPNSHRTFLRIQYRGMDVLRASSDIYGKRLTLFENASNQPELRLDGELLATGTAAPPGSMEVIAFEVDHAYPAGGGTYLDHAFSRYIAAGDSHVILNGWGPTSRKLLERHRTNLLDAMDAGNAADSEPVLGAALSLPASSYLAQETAALALADAVAGTITLNHHNVGFCGQKAGTYFDLPMSATSVVSARAPGGNTTAAFFAQGGIGSAFEWGVIEQSQPMQAVSTINLLDLANTDGGKIFDATLANYYTTVRPQLVATYGTQSLAYIDMYIDAGYRLILPENGNLNAGYWFGTGYLAIGPSGSSLSHMISGGLWGGSAIYPGDLSPQEMVYLENKCLVEDPNARSRDPINLVTGAFLYDTTDITVGSGAFPFSMAFERRYNSRARRTVGPLGRGWTHNFDITLREDSDGFQALGEDSPIDAAASIVELHVAQEVLAGGLSHARLLVASLCHKWFMDNLIHNAILVERPGNTHQFIRLPNGTYNPPPGSVAELKFTGADGYSVTTKGGTTFDFGWDYVVRTWTDRNDNTLSFSYLPDLVVHRLETVDNGMGRSITFEYADGDERVTAVTDHTGRRVSYAYDADGNLITATSPTGHDTVFEYDLPGRLTRFFYPGHPADPFVTNVYDAADKMTTQTDAVGNIYSYYLSGYRAEETDPLGHSMTLRFDDRGRAIRRTSAAGHEFSYTYDVHDRRTSTTYPEGDATTYTYDARHNPVVVTQHPKPGSPDDPIVRHYTYDPAVDRVATYTDPLNRITHFEYDGAGNLASIEQPTVDGIVPTRVFTYNTRGQLTSTTDPDGRSVAYAYDAATGDQVSTTVDPGGLELTLQVAYDDVGNAVQRTDPLSRTTIHDYDEARRLIQTTQPSPFDYVSKWTYGPSGEPLSIERATGDAGDPWQTVLYTYTPAGHLATLTDPNGGQTTYQFNELHKLWKVTDAENHVLEFQYDDNGRIYRMLDENGHIERQYAYTANGEIDTVTDANGNVTDYAYDAFDRLGGIEYPDGSFEAFTYDAASNLLHARNRAGQMVDYTYDDLNRLVEKSVPGSSTTAYGYGYDLAGRITETTDVAGTTLYDYDSAGRLQLVTDPEGRTVRHEYDAAGNRTQLVYPDSFAVDYQYDELNRLVHVGSAAPEPLVDFDGDGDVDLADYAHVQACFSGTDTTPPGCQDADVNNDDRVDASDFHVLQQALTGCDPVAVQASYTYDRLSRRSEASYGNGSAARYTVDLDNNVVELVNDLGPADLVFTYTHDAAGNKLTKTVNGADTSLYGYDPTGRLTTVDYPAGHFGIDTTFAYDDVGNRLWAFAEGIAQYEPNALNQYETVGGTAYTYGEMGNLTSDAVNTYAYDGESRLVLATTPDHAAGYTYDAFGRRIAKNVDGHVTSFVYDGDRVIAEYGDAGQLTARYVYAAGVDDRICMMQPSGTYYYHYDATGSVVALTDASGDVVETYEYDVFGQVNDAGSVGNPYLFTGRRLDAETGLYDYRARHYDPAIGRFVQPDPLRYTDGMNVYDYVHGSPTNLVDPSGMEGVIELGPQASESRANTVADVLQIFVEPLDGALKQKILTDNKNKYYEAELEIGPGNSELMAIYYVDRFVGFDPAEKDQLEYIYEIAPWNSLNRSEFADYPGIKVRTEVIVGGLPYDQRDVIYVKPGEAVLTAPGTTLVKDEYQRSYQVQEGKPYSFDQVLWALWTYFDK